MADNVEGIVQPGFDTGRAPPYIVNIIFKPIYGGTAIKASYSQRNDPQVAHKLMLPEVFTLSSLHYFVTYHQSLC